jgi:hypothetical protein
MFEVKLQTELSGGALGTFVFQTLYMGMPLNLGRGLFERVLF